jgi:hypothetical protein
MKLFPSGHATHPQWRMAAGLVLAQLRAQMALPDYASAPTLGLLYITDHYAVDAQEILDHLSAELPEVTDWAGTVGVGVSANNAEYFDEPGLSLMLCALPSDQYRVFSGVAPLASSEMSGFEAHTALVHADPATPDLTELIGEMAGRTDTGYLFGGLSSGRGGALQFAVGGNGNIRGQGAAGGVFSGRPVGRGVRRGRAAGVARHAGLPAAALGQRARARDHRGRRQPGAAARRRARARRAAGRPAGLARAAAGSHRGRARHPGGPGRCRQRRHPPHRRPRRRRAGAPHHRPRPHAPRHRDRRRGRGRHAPELLPPQRPGRARRPDAHLRRDPRGARARGTDPGHRARRRRRRGRGGAASRAPHRRRPST